MTCLLLVVIVASLPVPQETQQSPAVPAYVIMYDEKDGRHVQMGEPGKSVSGYFTSRSLDGLMEYKTMYEADENGYRARGDHLPVATAKAESRSDDAYIFNYEAPGSHQHYQMGQPGVAVQGSFMYVAYSRVLHLINCYIIYVLTYCTCTKFNYILQRRYYDPDGKGK